MKNCKCDFTWGYETIQCHRCEKRQPLKTKKQLDDEQKSNLEECLAVLHETV